MGDCLRTDKLSGYEANHLGQLSLLPSVGIQLLGWVIINGNGECSLLAAYRRASVSGRLVWSKGWHPPALFLHSSCEPNEPLQCSLSRMTAPQRLSRYYYHYTCVTVSGTINQCLAPCLITLQYPHAADNQWQCTPWHYKSASDAVQSL